MTSSRDLKKHLRKEALARRDALDEFWRVEVAAGMAAQAKAGIATAPGPVVFGIAAGRRRVDARPPVLGLRGRGARASAELVRGAPMVDMGFGTVGPHEEAEVLDPSVMLVPLAAFDARGHRIGYGAGYYDRAIAKLADKGLTPRLIGIAFDCQQVEMVPDENHDVIIPEILTESGLRQFPPQL